MPKPTTFVEAVPAVVDLAGKQYDLVHGDANTEVETDNGLVPSNAKAVADLNAEYAAQEVVTRSYAARDAALGAAAIAQAARDATLISASAKGTYGTVEQGMEGTVSGQYFYVSGSGRAPNAAMDLYLHNGDVAWYINSTMRFVPLPAESGFLAMWEDSVTGRCCLLVYLDGRILIPGLILGDGVVSLSSLGEEVSSLLPVPMPPESGKLFAYVDKVSRRTPLSIGVFGEVEIPGLILGDGVVQPASLSLDTRRLSVPNAADVIEVEPDLLRASLGSIGTRTQQDGSAWQAFPPLKTPVLRGLNTAAVSIDFRRSVNLPIRGVRYMGTYDPGVLASVGAPSNHVYITGGIPAASTLAAGLYLDSWNTNPIAYNGVTVNDGDLIVSVGVGVPYQIQAAPGSGTTRIEGDYWIVSAGGTMSGIALEAGDRIVYLGNQGQGGLGKWPLFYLGKPSNGELFYRGEWDASSGAYPASPLQGDLWSVSVAGVVSGFAFAPNDYALYESGVWGRVESEPITTVAAGAMIPALRCIQSASEWEVRRTDKSANRVGVTAAVRHQSNYRRNTDEIRLRSDSMFGTPGIQPKLAALLPGRNVTLTSSGGSTSREVLATFEQEIYAGDPSRGALNVFWHGQNNQPGAVGDANWCQIIDASLRMKSLIGARDARAYFWSVLGQNNMAFNGTRIVVSQHENQFNRTGPLYALEQWYAAMFPGQCFFPYRVLLAAAAGSALQDMRSPGKTEAETAVLYGWIPYSYWNNVAGFPFALAELNHQGFWSTAALPAGGAPHDAYLRTGGGTTGNLLVNVDGVWGEYQPDTTHQGGGPGQGGELLAAGFANVLTASNL